MRMSDKEFQEEVFRRRDLYEQRRTAKWKRVAVLSVLLCVCAGISIPQILKMRADFSNEFNQAKSDGHIQEESIYDYAAIQGTSNIYTTGEGSRGHDALPESIRISTEEDPAFWRYYMKEEKLTAVMACVTVQEDMLQYGSQQLLNEDGCDGNLNMSGSLELGSDDAVRDTASGKSGNSNGTASAEGDDSISDEAKYTETYAFYVTLTEKDGTETSYTITGTAAKMLEQLMLEYESD